MRRVVKRRPLRPLAEAAHLETAPSEADSEATSLVCVPEAHDTEAMARSAQSAGMEPGSLWRHLRVRTRTVNGFWRSLEAFGGCLGDVSW